MYRIISIKDKNGIEKVDFYNEMRLVHPSMSGEILYPEYIRVGNHFCLVWNDDIGKMLRTSTIEKVFHDEDVYVIETRNSIYTLEKENNKIEVPSSPTKDC